MKRIILIGAFIETVELCEKCGYEIAGIVDSEAKDTYLGYPVLGNDEQFLERKEDYLDIPLVLVPDSPRVRELLYNKYKSAGFCFETIVSPNAIVSKSASIGEACLIQDGCNISAAVQMGAGVRVNTGANIMHECSVADFVTVAPNAVVLGRCELKDRVYIGANATVLPGHVAEEDAMVGAACVVTKDVPSGVVVIGNPMRRLR